MCKIKECAGRCSGLGILVLKDRGASFDDVRVEVDGILELAEVVRLQALVVRSKHLRLDLLLRYTSAAGGVACMALPIEGIVDDREAKHRGRTTVAREGARGASGREGTSNREKEEQRQRIREQREHAMLAEPRQPPPASLLSLVCATTLAGDALASLRFEARVRQPKRLLRKERAMALYTSKEHGRGNHGRGCKPWSRTKPRLRGKQQAVGEAVWWCCLVLRGDSPTFQARNARATASHASRWSYCFFWLQRLWRAS